MEFPTTMLDFMHQFPNDYACRAYLEKMRWPNGFVCSRCQGTNASWKRLGPTVRGRIAGAHTIISNLKAWLLGTFRGVSHKHLDRYLKEFTYCLNRRWNEDKLFYYLTRRAVERKPLPYRRLIAELIG